MKYSELKELHKKARKIVASNLSWEEKYNLIFSPEICGKTEFDWNDPDMDYEDDVMSYMDSFDAHLLHEQINQ